jgi:NMD protein affecting ribosome stability and mRNA decay
MPRYHFVCPKCGLEEQNTVPSHIKEVACERCHPEEVWMRRLPPRVSKPTVKEFVDKRAKSAMEDQTAILKQRKEDYFWSVEVPRMVASGVYSVETMLENGWISVGDDGKMVVHTKPVGNR